GVTDPPVFSSTSCKYRPRSGLSDPYAVLDGGENADRAADTSSRVVQPTRWSLTRPIACMKANAVVGPTKRQPMRFRSFASAIAVGDVVIDWGTGTSAGSGS